jgi:hypothetical protein
MNPMPARDHRQIFAYGELALPDVMKDRCGAPHSLGSARIDGFRQGYFGYSRKWDGAVDSVKKQEGSSVWGVLYALDFDDGGLLDEFLDARLDGTGNHFHYPVVVTLENGETTDALMYVMSEMGPDRAPSTEFMAKLVEGARAQKLPVEWIEKLEATESVPAAYPVPKGSEVVRVDCGGYKDYREELRGVAT